MASRAVRPSRRAIANLESGTFIDLEDEASHLPQYDPESCPDGLINLAGAVNTLMGDVIKARMDDFAKTYPLENAARYGAVIGPRALSTAVASFVNRYFHPATPVEADHILPGNGVTSLIDSLAFNVCDPGEGIMVLVPTYMMFSHDLTARTGVQLVPVATPDVTDQYSAVYVAQVVGALDAAYDAAARKGIVVKAILLCNPCNPTGRTYSRVSLTEIARFCGRRGMHLISDEIYALSGFSPVEPGLDGFTSVLSLPDDPARGVFAENIHALYGASKDFAMGGLRLGFLITRNSLLWNTARRLALFSWLPSMSAAFFTHFLTDEEGVDEYVAVYQKRLKDNYVHAAELLKKHGVPFGPANCGMFLFVKLTKWLDRFDGSDPEETREMKLCRYLMLNSGVFLNAGELSLSPISGCFRFVYIVASPETVAVAIERLGKAVSELEKMPKVSDGELEARRPASVMSDDDDALMEKTRHNKALARRPKGRSLLRLLSCMPKE